MPVSYRTWGFAAVRGRTPKLKIGDIVRVIDYSDWPMKWPGRWRVVALYPQGYGVYGQGNPGDMSVDLDGIDVERKVGPFGAYGLELAGATEKELQEYLKTGEGDEPELIKLLKGIEP